FLQVESPGCLWGRVVEGPAGYAQSTGQFDHMMAQMNLFYSDVTQDQHKLRLTSFEQGQICVVYWPAVKSWCRAKMKAVITDSVSSQAQCFLVDYGEERVVPIDQIRVAMPDFLLLPFWVRRFHLSGIKPTRLQVSINDEKAKMIFPIISSKLSLYLSEQICNFSHLSLCNVNWTEVCSVRHVTVHKNHGSVHTLVLRSRLGSVWEQNAKPFACCFCVLLNQQFVLTLYKRESKINAVCSKCNNCCFVILIIHSVFPLQPCHSLDNAPITDQLRRLIQRKQLYSMCPADRYSWPAVVRGCNTLVVSPNADQPISYLPPLLTHVLLNSLFSLTSSTGPVVVVVCPGWEKAQAVFDFMEETKVSHILHPMIIHVGVKEDEAKTIKIPKNCMIVVSTPFSLVRVFSHHCFLFLRMYHLVLDEVDQLFTLAPEQMTNILQHFQKVVSSEDKRSCPQQIVAVSKRWTSQMEGLITSHMPHPSIIITVPEEAALYANIQQIILMSPESSKIDVLLGTLDFSPEVGLKTLIITSSPREADDVFEAVSNKSAFCMKSHEGLTHEFDFVVQQWRKSIDPGTHVILVTTNECLRCLGIHDASCIIHYGFPSSPRNFGSRLFSMVKNFRNLTEPVNTGRCLSRSVLIISERNARHVVGVLRYLGRTSAPLPPELLSFAQSVNVAREDQKTNRPLCSYLKSFGTCRDSSMCADRHCWNPHLDESELPTSGVLEVVPLLIKTASLFYGRIVTKEENNFESILAEITAFYTDKKQGATEVIEGALYAVQDDDVFHRVKVLSIPDRRDRLFFSVFVEFIDIGKREEVKAHQLLQLPEQFQSVPGQAVEIIVCRVKPSDSEKDWHPKVTRAISQKVKGLKHRARVVLSLGNTIFVDPMVRVSHVPGMKTVINEYNLQFEILNSGMAESNPEHINLLKALCE
ncbi:hypothetical protein NL108_012381, partial [Boleophthalmus pectinirostris]